MKKIAGYLVFVAYLSLAGVLCLYISKPTTSSGRQVVCGGQHRYVSVSPRDRDLAPEIILRPADGLYKSHPAASDESGSSNLPRFVSC